MIVDYIAKHGDDLAFTDCFWKRCEPHAREVIRYPLYARVLELYAGGADVRRISAMTNVKWYSVGRWIRFEQRPKLAHYLGAWLELGNPKPRWVWLSVNNTPGHAIPLGPFVQVPMVISSWHEVQEVLSNLEPLGKADPGLPQEYSLGFLLGMVIGDAAKSKSRNWHRHLGLVLSKKYDSNERIGEFTCSCARAIGLRMHRVSDQPKPRAKPYGFFEWVSQASPLVDWIFNVCLGLQDGQRTTYDPVKIDWALEAPEDFRRGLTQGLAESDGSVSIASQTVEFWIGPNWDFGRRLLLTFGIKSFKNREALSVTRTQVQGLGRIPAFSPLLKTVRWERLQKLVRAKHIGHGRRLSSEIRDFIARQKGLSVPQISERVLAEFGIAVGFETVQRWSRGSVN